MENGLTSNPMMKFQQLQIILFAVPPSIWRSFYAKLKWSSMWIAMDLSIWMPNLPSKILTSLMLTVSNLLIHTKIYRSLGITNISTTRVSPMQVIHCILGLSRGSMATTVVELCSKAKSPKKMLKSLPSNFCIEMMMNHMRAFSNWKLTLIGNTISFWLGYNFFCITLK